MKCQKREMVGLEKVGCHIIWFKTQSINQIKYCRGLLHCLYHHQPRVDNPNIWWNWMFFHQTTTYSSINTTRTLRPFVYVGSGQRYRKLAAQGVTPDFQMILSQNKEGILPVASLMWPNWRFWGKGVHFQRQRCIYWCL